MSVNDIIHHMEQRYCIRCKTAFKVYPSSKKVRCSLSCAAADQPSRVAPPDHNGCRLWTGGLATGGYGVIGIETGRTDRVHRVAWELSNNKKLESKECVCHACDVKLCCEPSHLWIGSLADNNADKMAKDRHRTVGRRGELRGSTVLTSAKVEQIRMRYATNTLFYTDLALEYGVTPGLIGQIVRGEIWPDAGGPRTSGRAGPRFKQGRPLQ
jgi:hypothetical protein